MGLLRELVTPLRRATICRALMTTRFIVCVRQKNMALIIGMVIGDTDLTYLS